MNVSMDFVITRLSAGQRSDLLRAVETAIKNADCATGPDDGPDPLPHQASNVGAKVDWNSLETLNLKAAGIPSSTGEIFAYCTSRTTSIEDVGQLL